MSILQVYIRRAIVRVIETGSAAWRTVLVTEPANSRPLWTGDGVDALTD